MVVIIAGIGVALNFVSYLERAWMRTPRRHGAWLFVPKAVCKTAVLNLDGARPEIDRREQSFTRVPIGS